MPPFEFLGPYRVGEPLGRGGMGTVYRAVHEKTKEPVAVKLIAAQVADEPRFRKRFDAEVKSLQLLRHEGIVRLIGFGEEEGQLFYSMELVEGESLQDRIKREKKLDWMVAIDIAIETCAALKHAHDIGVIHRDLKPANLLLTSTNHVKLVDFGIARIFGDEQYTMVGSVLGTADYMAPEQLTSEGITVRTDLYSLGSMMYAMLVGRPPFRGKSTTAVMKSLEKVRPVPLDMIDPDLPEELVELVQQLLEKDPADRPPTALAVMNRLKAMRAGLQNAQTMMGRESPTELGAGAKQDADGELVDLGSTPTGLETAETSSFGEKAKDSHATNITEEPTQIRRAVDSDATDASIALPGDGDDGVSTKATEVSDTRKSKPARASKSKAADSDRKTHFKTVDGCETGHRLFSDDHRSSSSLTQVLSIVAMVAVLIGGIALMINAMRPPSADELYRTAVSEDSRGAKSAFLKQYPDDPRASEVRDLLMEDRLRATQLRLETQAKIGMKPLSAQELAFVEAINEREQNPIAATKRLGNWLAAFPSAKDTDDELLELAEHELSRLKRTDFVRGVDAKVNELLEQIEAASQLDDQAAATKQLQGIIETFVDQEWAEPAIARARQVMADSSNQ